MASSRSQKFLNITTLFSFTLFLSSLPSSLSSSQRFSKIYAFGDSFTDTGNTHSSTGPSNFGHVSSPPYGVTFFHRPTNRYSDGRLVIDFVAAALNLPFLPPYLSKTSDFSHGVNFAVAGATAISHEFFVTNNASLDITPESIGTQLRWFDKFMEERGCRVGGTVECEREMESALFWVGEIGANDYAYILGSGVEPQTIQHLGIRYVHTVLKSLLDRGAKFMVVEGVPLTGCLPLTMYLAPADDRDELGCSAIANKYCNGYNQLLQASLHQLRTQYPHATIIYADYYAAHRKIMSNPGSYGFAEPFKTCCGSGGGPYNFDVFATCGSPSAAKACSDPAKFVNWDGVHLTEATYRIVADMFIRQGYCQPPFNTFFN